MTQQEIMERLRERALGLHRALDEGNAYRAPVSEEEFLRRIGEHLKKTGLSLAQEASYLELNILTWPNFALYDIDDVIYTSTYDSEDSGEGYYTSLERLLAGSPFTFHWEYDPEAQRLTFAVDSEIWSVECDDLYGEEVFLNPVTFGRIDPLLFDHLRRHGWYLYEAYTGDQTGRDVLVPLEAVGGLKEYLISWDDPRIEQYLGGPRHKKRWWQFWR